MGTSTTPETPPAFSSNKSESKEGVITTSPLKTILYLLIAAVMGLTFGFAFEKSRVFEPQSIRDQFILKRFIMLKMFLAAVSITCIVLYIVIIFFNDHYRRLRKLWTQSCKRGVVNGVIIGAALLGIGMAVAGIIGLIH